MTGQVTLFRFQLDHHFLEELLHHLCKLVMKFQAIKEIIIKKQVFPKERMRRPVNQSAVNQ